MPLPSHLMTSEPDGNLYDTRPDGWSRLPPLRRPYSRHFRDITDGHKLKASLRAGSHTDLGGYPLYFITSDGGVLSFAAVRAELTQVLAAIASRDNSGWRVVHCEINYEDSELTCDHTGELIPSAYGDPD